METPPGDLTASAHRWILRGGTLPATAAELAAECDRIIRTELSKSAKRALKLAEKFYKQTFRSSDPDLKLAATRARARCLHMAGRHREAADGYRRARTLAIARREPLTTARIDRALADVYMYLNRYDDAQASSQRAIRTFRRMKAEADAVQTEVNLANLMHRRDRHADASEIYERARAFFAEAGDELSEARAAYNHGNTLVQMFDWERATAAYRRAETMYDASSLTLDANDARYGLAYMDLLADRFADALNRLSECERIYRENGDPRGAALCVLDRAEAYLGLNLHSEALESARRARHEFRQLKLRYETAKAELFTAHALIGLGTAGQARAHARRARTAFLSEKNEGMAAATLLLMAQLGARPGARRRGLLEARKQFRSAQLPIWSTLCDLRLLAEPSPPSAVTRRLARDQQFRRVPHWSALYDTWQGERACAAGRQAQARKFWHRAADTLERARAALPPLEVRAAYLSGRSDPYRRLVATDVSRNTMSAATWAERLKTAGIWRPVRPLGELEPEAQRLMQEWRGLSAQLAAVARQVRAGRGTGTRAAMTAERTMRSLEREGRRVLTRLEGYRLQRDDAEGDLEGRIAELSQRLPIVMWHSAGRDLHAFVIRKGEARHHAWPDGVSRLSLELRRWRFFMERHMFTANAEPLDDDPAPELQYWSEMGEWLWRPIELREEGVEVLIVPDGGLFALPFAALRAEGRWLGDVISPIVVPSIRHYLSARQTPAPEAGAEIFDAGGADLGEVKGEVDALVTLMKEGDYRLHRPARRDELLNLSSVRLWHFAGHARFRADNPFYSTLHTEQDPVFAADLRTRHVPVALATLSACHSGGGAAAPGEEYAGLVRSILEMGARSVIAALWPVSDASTAHWMSVFYREWMADRPLTAAVRAAGQVTREKWPSPYHWGAFTLFGSES